MSKPNFDLMWKNFPDHARWPTLQDLYKHIGGQLASNINVPGFGPNGNTCATRLSRALNYGGALIDVKLTKALKVRTLMGADRMHYIFSVRELKKYLESSLGGPSVDKKVPIGDIFATKRGIVAMDVRGWNDATGHVALWDGAQFREPSHDDYIHSLDGVAQAVTGASLWKM
jgi:Type VI secretion system (T6SS), amidase effector protein 4